MPRKQSAASKIYDIVEVLWTDAEEYGETGWNDLKEMLGYAKKSCPVMRTVGYLVFKGKDHMSLLSSIGERECSTVEKIPLAFIKSVTVLKPAPSQKVSSPPSTQTK